MLLELIQVSLGKRERLSRTLSAKEWQDVYEMAQKQSVAGVCLKGMSRLPKEQQPPEELYWEWYGVAVQIQFTNAKVDEQAASVWRKLKDAGLDAAILKGQRIATEYGELASLRQSGDIDVWVLGGERGDGYLFHRKTKLVIINSQAMPRQARQVSGTGIYHVMMRGINHQNRRTKQEQR